MKMNPTGLLERVFANFFNDYSPKCATWELVSVKRGADEMSFVGREQKMSRLRPLFSCVELSTRVLDPRPKSAIRSLLGQLGGAYLAPNSPVFVY